MARLRSLNLKIKFDISFNNFEPIIEYKNIPVNEINLTVDKFDQSEKIIFKNFTFKDPKQKIECKIEYNGLTLDLHSISRFKMANNKYVDNIEIDNCVEVHFNGCMIIDFNKLWFKHNILAGANIGDQYCNWDKVHFDQQTLFCIGDSFTYGDGVKPEHAWPALLDQNSCNFGCNGLSHDGCLMNVNYILNHSRNVKKIICLLPTPFRRLFKFNFFDQEGVIPVSHNSQWKLPIEFLNDVEELKKKIITQNPHSDWIDSCNNIITSCESRGVKVWVSTWYKELHKQIPEKNRLPVFPDLDTFPERGDDGDHPHKKHYDLFVKNIRPYIDM